MNDDVRIVALPHPFLTERVDLICEAGGSLADVLDRSGLRFHAAIDARICVNDQVIPRDRWETFSPKADDIITLRAIPQGGGGGKNVLRVVMTIALIATMPYVGAIAGTALGSVLGTSGLVVSGMATVAQAGVLAGGMALINSICPPPKHSVRANDGTGTSQSYGIEGARNQLAHWNPIPVILGRHRVYPPYAAKPYTEVNGNDQYLHALFCIGHGPLDITDPKIGETDITEFQVGDVPEDRLAFEVWPYFDPDTDDLLYFRDNCEELSLSVLLEQANSWETRQTEADIDEISVDISAPQGIVTFDSDGDKVQTTVDFTIEYKKTADSTWSIARAGQALSAQNSGTIPQPGEFYYRTGNHEDGYEMSTKTGYGYIIIGLNKTSGEVSLHYRKARKALGVPLGSGIQVYETAAQAKTNCPRPPEYIAILAGIAWDSDDTAINTGNIDNTMRSDDLDCSTSTDFLVAPTATPGATVDIAAGTLYFRPQFVGATNNAIRRTYRFAVDNGTYDVRVRRETADTDSDKIYDKIYWTCLRSITKASPIALAGLALVEMRVKATDQLNGVIDTFNCVAQSILPDWNGTTWAEGPTNNPASLFRAVLQGAANKRPVADGRLDLTELQDWHEECEGKGYSFNQVIDYQGTVQEICQNIAAAGRASLAYKDGTFSVIQDKPRTAITQHFTPHNSWGFRSSKTMLTLPHGFKVRYPDEDADWQSAERIVYADGYTESNATEFEELQLPGITDSDLAWMHGRFHLAQLILRPEEYSFQTDIENLVCTRGDLIRVNHDVTMWGLGSGRIKSFPENLIANPGLENWDVPVMLPKGWYDVYPHLSDVSRSDTNIRSGGAGLKTKFGTSYTDIRQVLGENTSEVEAIYGSSGEKDPSKFVAGSGAVITYDEDEDSPTGKGCFRYTQGTATRLLYVSEQFDVSDLAAEGITVEGYVKSISGSGRIYMGIDCELEDGTSIPSAYCYRYGALSSTLYADFVAGSSYCDIVPPSGAWYTSSAYIQFDIDVDGSELPLFSTNKIVRIGSIDTSDPNFWRVYFYSGATCTASYSAGTAVGHSRSLTGYNYCAVGGNVIDSDEWVKFRGFVTGLQNPLVEHEETFCWRRGTTKFRIIMYLGYGGEAEVLFNDLTLRRFINPLPDMIGETVTLGCWAYTGRSSNAIARLISFNGNVGISSYATEDDWDYLTCSRTIASDDAFLVVQLYENSNASDSDVWWDEITLAEGTTISQIKLTETVTMETGETYAVRIRKADGTTFTAAVDTEVGETDTLTLSTPITLENSPSKGDLVMFGETDLESVELLVKSITPGDDLTATITAVDYSPAVYTADTGTIPAFDPGISIPAAPHAPLILNVRSDEWVMVRQKNGTWVVRMLVTLGHSSNKRMHDVVRIEGQYRIHDPAGPWIKLAQIPRDATEVSLYDVETGVTYEIRFRYVFVDGAFGPWTSYYEHTVIGKSGNPSDVSFDDANCVFQKDKITFRWLAILDPDLDFYELRTDENWGETAGLIACVPAGTTKYIYPKPDADDDTYYIKARDTSGNYSTNADSITPNPDTLTMPAVTADFTTNDLHLYWSSIDPTILAYYTVALYSDAYTTCVFTSNQFTDSHFIFTFERNDALTAGPYREFYIRVTVQDIYGRTGYYDTYAINAAPSKITTLQLIPGLQSLTTLCDPLFADILGYEFACDTDNPPTDSQEVGMNFLHWTGLTGGETYYCRVRARDAFGYGEWSDVDSEEPLSVDIDETDLDVPITRGAVWSAAGSVLSWNAHQVLYQGTFYDIAAGNASSDVFVYWDAGSPTSYSHGNTVAVAAGRWIMCHRSSTDALPAMQSPLIHGGLIQATTVTLSKLLGTGSLSIGSSGTLSIASGGTLNMSGGSINMTAGTFTISGGTLSITSSGAIDVAAGRSITLQAGSSSAGAALLVGGHGTYPGEVQIYQSGVTGAHLKIGGYGSNTYRIVPSTTSQTLTFGIDGTRWSTINMYSSGALYLGGAGTITLYSSGGDGVAIGAYGSGDYVSITGAGGIKITGDLRSDSSTNIARIDVGSYTGNGSTSTRTITSSLGFDPILVLIFLITADEASTYIFMAGPLTDAGTGDTYSFSHGANSFYTAFDPTCIDIVTGGFAVKYGHSWWPNVNGSTYEYICIG